MAEIVILYRIVHTESPTVDDMKSYAELGIPLRHDSQEARRKAKGVSMFDSLEQARRQARGKPWLGDAHIAEIVFPADRFQFEKSGGRGHYTVWGNAHDILGYVTRVTRA